MLSVLHLIPEKINANPTKAPSGNVISDTNLVAILVPICLVVLILVVVLGIYVIRHHRLQRSFVSFANSHYDTRSGTTTFGSANELGKLGHALVNESKLCLYLPINAF